MTASGMALRKSLRATLWASAHPWPVLGITTAVTLLAWFLAGQATGRLAAGLPPRAAACWLRLVREQRGSFSGEIGGQSPVPSGPSAVLLA
jgi:hypothetical protein